MKIKTKTIQRFKQLVNVKSNIVFHRKCTMTLKGLISSMKAMTAIYTHSHAMEYKMISSRDIKEGFMEMVFQIRLERWIRFVKRGQ